MLSGALPPVMDAKSAIVRTPQCFAHGSLRSVCVLNETLLDVFSYNHGIRKNLKKKQPGAITASTSGADCIPIAARGRELAVVRHMDFGGRA
jgi:hypothetical protein